MANHTATTSNTKFQSKLALGAIAEKKVMDFYFQRHSEQLSDARNNPAYQTIDVDFISGRDGYIEVKYDANPERSILVETTQNIYTNSQGWLHTTQADILAYYQAPDDLLLLIDMPRLRALVYRLIRTHATKLCPEYKPRRTVSRVRRLTWDTLIAAGVLLSAHIEDINGIWCDVFFDSL